MCDSTTHYVWKLEVYLGKQPGNVGDKNQGEGVVLRLASDIGQTGRNVTCDNFFTSLSLAKKLMAKKLSILGTLRKNRKEFPKQFADSKGRAPFSTMFGFTEKCMIASYCPRKGKVVTLLSTMHQDAEVVHSNNFKPRLITDYNQSKAGVDTMDQMVRCYSCKRKTRRWLMAISYNIVDVSALNAFIIFFTLNP